MSFNRILQIPKGTSQSDAMELVEGMDSGTVETDVNAETIRAISVAKSAVMTLIEEDAVGTTESHAWLVQIYGHVNPSNLQRDGWANDQVTVVLRQLDDAPRTIPEPPDVGVLTDAPPVVWGDNLEVPGVNTDGSAVMPNGEIEGGGGGCVMDTPTS